MKHATARDSGPCSPGLARRSRAGTDRASTRVAAAANVAGMDAYRAGRRGRTGQRGILGAPGARDAGLAQAVHPGAGRYPCALYRWFGDGRLNASFNCLDGTSPAGWASTAIVFEADDGAVTPISYRALLARV